MLTSRMERMWRAGGIYRRGGDLSLALALSSWVGLCALPARLNAQCGEGGDFTGQCVDLEWRPAVQTVVVGGTVEVGLYAVSVNALDQPIQNIGAVLGWDHPLIKLLGNKICDGGLNDGAPCLSSSDCSPVGTSCIDVCEAGSDPLCYACPAGDPPGAPASYNWMSSGFPNDSGLDGLNDPFAGLPSNDGDCYYIAIKQIVCNGSFAPPAYAPPDGLLVTKFRFEVLDPGVAEVSMLAGAECGSQQMICIRGNPGTVGNPCTTDDDCGERACVGGSSQGAPCASEVECPEGVCPVLCTACEHDCCTADDNCTLCSFAETRVIGGVEFGSDVTRTIGPPAQITILDCQPPTVSVGGPRYLNITPNAETGPVAFRVTGVDVDTFCALYVQRTAHLGSTPVFMTPAEWTDIFDVNPGLGDPFDDPTDPTVYLRGPKIVAGRTYDVQADCSPANPGANPSDPVTVTLWGWGDVDNDGDRSILDVVRILDGFQGVWYNYGAPCTTDAECAVIPEVPGSGIGPHYACNTEAGFCVWITRENVDLIGDTPQDCTPNRDIAITDVVAALDAFAGVPSPCQGGCP